MNRKIWNYLEIAAELACSQRDGRHFFIGAIGIRSDGRMVKSFNGHPRNVKIPAAHAEFRLSRKLDVGAELYVARVTVGNFEFALAKPCGGCQSALKSAGVKKVYYTVGNNRFEIMRF